MKEISRNDWHCWPIMDTDLPTSEGISRKLISSSTHTTLSMLSAHFYHWEERTGTCKPWASESILPNNHQMWKYYTMITTALLCYYVFSYSTYFGFAPLWLVNLVLQIIYLLYNMLLYIYLYVIASSVKLQQVTIKLFCYWYIWQSNIHDSWQYLQMHCRKHSGRMD